MVSVRPAQPAGDGRQGGSILVRRDDAGGQLPGEAAEAALYPGGRRFPEEHVIRKMPVAQKVHALSHRKDGVLAQTQLEPVTQESLDLAGQVGQVPLVVVEKAEVVAVADVGLHPVAVLEPLIQLVEVQVSQPLARIVADRDILPALVAVDDLPQELQRVMAFDLPGDDTHQDVVIHRDVELGYVHLQAVTISADVPHRPAAAGVQAPAFDAGVGIGQEKSLPDRLDDAHQAVVDDPVRAEGQLEDLPLFRLVDCHRPVGGRPIGLRRQQMLHPGQNLIEMLFAIPDDPERGLAFPRLLIGRPDIVRIDDLLVQSAVSLHGLS